MIVKLNQQEAKFVDFILDKMRRFRPTEYKYLNFKKSDVQIIKKGILYLSTSEANENLLEFMLAGIDQMRELDCDQKDIQYATSAYSKIKEEIDGTACTGSFDSES